jgi:hypothetical protein
MTPRQLWKFAFLFEAARDGLTEAETVALIDRLERAVRHEKRAIIKEIFDAGKSLVGGGVELLKGVGSVAAPVAIGGSVLAGGAAGALLAKLREGSFDTDAAKKQELIAAYNSFADEAEQRRHNRRPAGSTIRVPLG